MIYLFNQLEELIDVIDEASLAEFTHTIELNQFDRSSFEIPVDYKPDIIKEAQFFGFQSRDRAFCLFRISEKSYDSGLTIEGIDRAESDLHSFIIEDKRPSGTADQVLRGILEGTGYQLGDTNRLIVNGKMSFYYISVRQALVKIIESFGCEFRVRYTFVENKIIGRYIDLYQRFGRKTGHQFEYGSNILNVTYEESSDEVVTALIGRGRGEQSTDDTGEATGGYGRRIQFKDVTWSVSKGDPVDKPAGQNYVANEAARNTYGLHQNGVIKHRFGVYTNENIEDPVELLKATYKELQRLSVPVTTFKANLLDLANAIEQDIWIGDSVGIVRDQIGIAFEARIHRLVIDKLDDNRSVAELGDYQTLQAKDRTTRQQAIIDAVSGFSESLIEEAFANEVERRDKEFDEKMRINKLGFDNALESVKAKAEEVKQELSDTIDQRFSSFDNGPLQEIKRKAIEALQNAGASSLLAQEAKRIGLDSIATLEEFKRQATSAQTALSGDLDVLKRTVASEVNQASEYRRTTTEALSRMTGQMNGFATKSEVAQGIDGLTETFAKMKVGGRNYYRNSDKLVTRPRFIQFDVYPYLTAENIGQDWTFSFDLKINETGTVRQLHFYHYQRNGLAIEVDTFFNPSKEWQRYSFTAKVVQGGTNPAYAKGAMAIYDHAGDNDISIRNIKFEKGTLATDWSPAPEDTDSLITEAKATFERTAQGLRTDLSAIQTYVDKDGQRQEELKSYARNESITRINIYRQDVARNYILRSRYDEDAKSIRQQFESITNSQSGLIATKIADYKHSVDGRFTDITSLISGKANQTDFQRVKETSQLYERILGNTDNGIADNVARMAMTSQLFQVEVGKAAQKGRNYYRDSEKVQTKTRFFAFPLHPYLTQENIGETWTLSFDLKINEGGEIRPLHFYHYQNNRFGLKASADITPNKEWQRFTFTGPVIFPNDDPRYARGEMALYDFAGNNSYSVRRIKFERGSVATPWSPAPEDNDEAIRTVQSQLAGSWGVHNKNSVNEIIAGFNLAGRNAGIKAETIRLEGNTLADKLTAIDGYFKRLLVGEGTFATLNADVIRTNSITADKLVFNEALANRLVSNEIITNKMVASRAFVNALKAVTIDASQIVTGTLRGDRIYGGVIRGTEINGTTITGNSRITIGDNGFLRPTQEGGLQINVPETFNASKGIGVQLFGRNFGQIPKGMFIYNSPNWNGGNLIGESVADTLLTVKGLTSLCNLYRGQPMSGLPINSNFRYGDPVGNLYRISFIAWDPRHGQMFVNDGTDTDGTWWFKPDASSSDKRLKTNIQDTDFEATDFVKKLEFKQFDWKPDKFGYKKPYTNVGLIAQDVEKLDSSLVYSQGENLALDDFRLGNIALKAIQELSQRIETLERKLA